MNYLDKLYDAFESDDYVPESDLQFWWSQLTQLEKNEFADYMGMSISGVEEELGLDDRFGSSKRKGSRKGSTVQQVVDAFDSDIPNWQLIQLARELPDGLGEEVIDALGVGAWRGDTPEEEEFFRIIDSKFPRRGSRKGQDFTAHGIRNVAQGFKDVTGGQTKERMSNAWDAWDHKRSGSRIGSGPLNNLGPVSGKGSRPANLGEIASKVSLGRHRSINMDGEYIEPPVIGEQEGREGGILRDTAKFLTNGAKVVGNGIHAIGDELFDGAKDALADTSTDFDSVSGVIKGKSSNQSTNNIEHPITDGPFDNDIKSPR